MSIEIREIEIKATVDEKPTERTEGFKSETIEEIIQEAVERVLEILKKRNEI